MKKVLLLSFITMLICNSVFAQKDFSAPQIVKEGTVIVKGETINGSKASLFESFETAVPPAGWIKANPDGGSGWAQVSDASSLPGWNDGEMTLPPSGGSKAAFCTWNTGGTSSNDQWLITPALDIESGDILTFWIWHFSEFDDNVQILLSTTDSNTSSFTETIADLNYDATVDWTEHTYDLSAFAGQTVFIGFRDLVADNQTEGGFVAIDLFQIGTLESIDLTLTTLNTPTYSKHGDVDISGSIINNGADDITNFDVSYNINGGAESATNNVTGISIPLGGSYDFTHNVPYNFNIDGTLPINVSISNVNGGGENNLDDNILSKDIIVYSNAVQRKTVLENFTTGQCPNCPPIHVLLEDYVASEPNAILIGQHAGYYTDEMTIPENEELLTLYNGGTYAPALTLDRHQYDIGLTGGSPDPGPVFWPGESTSATTAWIDERITVPAFVTLNMKGSHNSKGNLELEVSGELIGDVSGDDLRLVVYILEDKLIYSQSGGSLNYEHNNVMRDAISETWGDAGIITSNAGGTTFSQTYAYTTDPSWKEDNLYIVAFVANYDGSNVSNREILNAEEVKLTDLFPSEIILATNPTDGTTDVAVLSDVVLTFNQTMRLVNDNPITIDNVSGFVHLTDPSKGDLTYTAAVNDNQSVITITPDVPFSETVTITVTIDNNEIENIEDDVLSGNSFSFISDTNPEASVVFNPKNDSTGIYVNSNIILTYGSAMRKLDDSEITDGDISTMVTLTDPSKGEIAYTATINEEKTIIIIDPDEDFTVLTNITVSIADAVVENQFDKALPASSATFTTSATTGISTLFSKVSIYPNPAANTVTITNAEKLSISLIDIYGKLVLNKKIISDSEEIDLSSLASGFYIVNFKNEGFKSSKRLIISK